MIANKVSGGDPDKFLDLMNQRAQEIGMTNTKWNNPNGAPTAVLDGYYNPTRYDQNAINQTTAEEIWLFWLITWSMMFPEILNYTKMLRLPSSKVQIMKKPMKIIIIPWKVEDIL